MTQSANDVHINAPTTTLQIEHYTPLPEADTSAGFQYYVPSHQPGKRARYLKALPESNVEIQNAGPSVIGPIYQYRDLGQEGGVYEQVSGPSNQVESAVRTIFEMVQLPEDSVSTDFESPNLDENPTVETTDVPVYVWTSTLQEKDVGEFIHLVFKQRTSVAVAAAKTGIKAPTAYYLKKKFENSDQSMLPGYVLKSEMKKPCHNQKIQKEHSDYILQMLNNNPMVPVDDIREELIQEFSG